MKILIVDDQPMMLKTLEIKFTREGYEVLTTNSLVESLAIIEDQNIDVVLCEVAPPDSPEFEILKAAKKKNYNTVVIIISVHSKEQTIIHAFEWGAEEYLVKPINLNLLTVRIRKLLKVKKMREVLAMSIPASERPRILQQLSSLRLLNSPGDNNEQSTRINEYKVPSFPSILTSPQRVVSRTPIPTPVKENKQPTKIETEDEDDGLMENSSKFQSKLSRALISYIPNFILFFVFFILIRAFELISDLVMHGSPKFFGLVISYGLIKDVLFCLHTGFILLILYALLYLINKTFAKTILITLLFFILLTQICLSQYFLTTLVPLGSDLWSYSFADIDQTVKASGGLSSTIVVILVFAIVLILIAFIIIPKKFHTKNTAAFTIAGLMALSLLIDNSKTNKSLMPGKEYSNNLSVNKSWYFYNASWLHFFPTDNKGLYDAPSSAGSNENQNNNKGAEGAVSFNYVDPVHFPFLHTIDTSRDVLSTFFDSSKVQPNIVIILVEGLGRAFTNKNAYLGNFTPFLDSLSEKSLYWENFLSEGGRTFAVLPSLIGSLPFHKTGFNEMGDKMSPHVSLLSILKHDGYNTSFYYGGDSHFDNMDIYLKKNEVDNIYDENTFPSSYSKMPSSESGFSWGFGDKELFRRYFETKQRSTAPFASVLLTVSTHSPFIVNNEALYLQRFNERLNELKFDETKKAEATNYKNQYASILFMDDAIRGFINQYKTRPDFANTIFLITGDHRMPEIPMSTKIDRYHVPLMIYSPLLKKSATFSSISTHFDIASSMTVLLHNKYRLNIPSIAQFLGYGLDTSRTFRSIHTYPFKQTKNEGINDFMMGEYLLNENNLFKIFGTMDIEPESNPAKVQEINSAMENFKRKNDQFIQTGKLIPDTLAQKWGSK